VIGPSQPVASTLNAKWRLCDWAQMPISALETHIVLSRARAGLDIGIRSVASHRRVAPDFTVASTKGEVSLHAWAIESWVFFFSHPADFTAVCTTEMGRAAQLSAQLETRNVKPLVEKRLRWISDTNETQHTDLRLPIIADPELKIAKA
jgi:hypothetical protein